MSTQKEMLAMVRKLIADEQAVGFTEGGNLEEPEGTQELLNYLDRAVDAYSKRQAAANDPLFLKRINIVDGSPVPKDFLAFAGEIPVTLEGGLINYYGPITDLPARYYARLPFVTDYNPTDELPYAHDVYVILCAMAAVYALNKHEFDISQDLQLLALGNGGGENASGE